MSDREYHKLLNEIVDLIYDSYDSDWKDMANESGCSLSTVYKLGNRITKRPQLRTILKLAKAARVKIIIDFKTKKLRMAA